MYRQTLKPPDVPWCASSSTLHWSPVVADPAGTRPWMPGSGLDPGPHTACGVATCGGSARVAVGTRAGFCPVPCPSASRSLSGPSAPNAFNAGSAITIAITRIGAAGPRRQPPIAREATTASLPMRRFPERCSGQTARDLSDSCTRVFVTPARRPLARLRRLRDLLVGSRLTPTDALAAGILDLFEEQVYAGEVTADGHYIGHSPTPPWARFVGGEVPDGTPAGAFWESRIHPDDWADYAAFNAALLRGEDAEAKYRLSGLDGVTRVIQDRARPQRRADGTVWVRGIISDVTRREEADARLAEASDRFSRLLDVVGEHVYLARAFPDGRIEELFQGPGADRLLGGAVPDPDMANWEAALHPADRPAYD